MTGRLTRLRTLVAMVLAAALAALAAPTPASASRTIPELGQMPYDPLAFNAWCFNVLHNQGITFGFADSEVGAQAGFAMADARERFLSLSQASGMDGAERDAFDQAMFTATATVAQAAASGSLKGAARSLYDACQTKGVRGARYKSLYVDAYEGMDVKLWCGSTLAALDERRLLAGRNEEVERARRALKQLTDLRDRVFAFLDVPEADRTLLEAGYHYRALVQVEALRLAQGDTSKLERNYDICLPMEALRATDAQPPSPPPDRPALAAPGWDYPLSADFRLYAWCYGAMHVFTDGQMPPDFALTEKEALKLIGDLHFHMLREAKGLRLSDEVLASMEVEAYHQAAYEFARPATPAGIRPLSYSYDLCPRAKLDVGEMLDVDSLQKMLDGFTAPQPDAEFNDTVWCLAGLERVLGSETDREKRSALKEGLSSLANIAARLGRELGLSGDVMMARLTEMKPVVDKEIRTRRRDDGKLMIAVCLERGLGYSDVFYDWVDP